MKKKIIAKDIDHLKDLIGKEIRANGSQCDLNHIDISRIKKMSYVFENMSYSFNGNISKWDMSNVEDTSYMFYKSEFNGDISNWDVSNVKDMNMMFMRTNLNCNISKWNIRNVEEIRNMFYECSCDIPYWAEFEDKQNRINAFDNYWLKKDLDNALNDKNEKNKKIKI
jgi:surface protein